MVPLDHLWAGFLGQNGVLLNVPDNCLSSLGPMMASCDKVFLLFVIFFQLHRIVMVVLASVMMSKFWLVMTRHSTWLGSRSHTTCSNTSVLRKTFQPSFPTYTVLWVGLMLIRCQIWPCVSPVPTLMLVTGLFMDVALLIIGSIPSRLRWDRRWINKSQIQMWFQILYMLHRLYTTSLTWRNDMGLLRIWIQRMFSECVLGTSIMSINSETLNIEFLNSMKTGDDGTQIFVVRGETTFGQMKK